MPQEKGDGGPKGFVAALALTDNVAVTRIELRLVGQVSSTPQRG